LTKKKTRRASHRRALTRERVLAEGLVLLDREGFEALTIRHLADNLSVTPMALYNHVSGKQDLLQGVAQHLLTQTRFSSGHSDWRRCIRECFRELRRVCLAHPSAVRVMEAIEVAPLAIFRPMEITLAALDKVVESRADALRAYFLLMNFTLGQVSSEVRGPFPSLDLRVALRDRKPLGIDLAHVERMSSLKSWDFDRAFEFGLSVILTGLEKVGGKLK
jgi:TetR/AcrR family transcriptional regulator, tetracycline repressor protein